MYTYLPDLSTPKFKIQSVMYKEMYVNFSHRSCFHLKPLKFLVFRIDDPDS